MTMETTNSLSPAAPSELPRQPAPDSRLLKWVNGGAHAISGIVLIYAFIFNGELSRAMIRPAAMSGEVNLGLVVGILFLVRFVWVHSRPSGGGRWAGASVPLPVSQIRRFTDWGIYLGVAATVISGLLIAHLRPGAVIDPAIRGSLTNRFGLNVAIILHVHLTTVLEWLCGFHVAYVIWFWKIRKTRWGGIAERWADRFVAVAERLGVMRLWGRS